MSGTGVGRGQVTVLRPDEHLVDSGKCGDDWVNIGIQISVFSFCCKMQKK